MGALVYKAAMQAFLSLFNENFSFDDYKKMFITIDDIKVSLRPGIEKNIIFAEDEDTSISLETRFATYKETTTLPLSKDTSDAEIFWFAIFSYLSQAFHILFTCTNYQLNPYIPFDIAIKYMLILLANFKGNSEIQTMVFRAAVSHILHRTFNKEKVKHIDFKKYYNIIKESDFESRLFSQLKEQSITIDNLKVGLISEIIDNILNQII